MKQVTIYFLLFITFVAAIQSCDKKDLIAENDKWIFPDTSNVGYVRFIHSHAAIAPQIPGASANTGPQVFMYANGQKLNGNALSYGGNWPSPNVYATIPVGNLNFQAVLARMNTAVTPNIPAPIAGDTILKYTYTVEKGKFYSMILVDTLPAMKIFVKEDDMTLPAVNKYRLRLINTTANPLDTLSVYSRNLKQFVINGVRHKETSLFVELDVLTSSDTLEVRNPNGATALYYVGSQTAPQAFTPVSQRIYTVVCRGKNGLTSKTPSASLVTNR
jgi:hypothetical protein